jgi:aryl-alcohol dehydrogenase-like predicted oxidoreductase
MTMNLLLGTAQWGWTIAPSTAFDILEAWVHAGETRIDGATNYPIDQNPDHFRRSESILKDFIRAHGLHNLRINMKVGSLNNMRTTDNNLSPSFLLMMAEEYLLQFDNQLDTLMIHWDHRDQAQDIRESLLALVDIADQFGIQPGLSGIRFPEAYAEAMDGLQQSFEIQCKHNVFHSDLTRYAHLLGQGHRFQVYGINAGGIRLHADYPEGSTFLARGGREDAVSEQLANLRQRVPEWNLAFVRPPIRQMNQIGLIYSALNPDVDSIVLGVSSRDQLIQTTEFLRDLDMFDYQDVYEGLKRI